MWHRLLQRNENPKAGKAQWKYKTWQSQAGLKVPPYGILFAHIPTVPAVNSTKYCIFLGILYMKSSCWPWWPVERDLVPGPEPGQGLLYGALHRPAVLALMEDGPLVKRDTGELLLVAPALLETNAQCVPLLLANSRVSHQNLSPLYANLKKYLCMTSRGGRGRSRPLPGRPEVRPTSFSVLPEIFFPNAPNFLPNAPQSRFI